MAEHAQINSHKPDFKYILQEASLILILSFLFFIAGTQHFGLVNPSIFTITTALIFLCTFYLLIHGQISETGTSIPAWIFIAVLVLASFFSLDPRRSLAEVWLVGLTFFWGLVFFEITHRGFAPELVTKVLLIVGVIFLSISGAEVYRWYSAWISNNPGQWIPDIQYRLIHPNFKAAVLNMLLMLIATRYFFTRSRFLRVILLLYALISLIFLYLTSSRGGWIGTFVGFLFLIAVSNFLARDWWKRTWEYLKSKKWIFVALVIILILLAASLVWIILQQEKLPTHGSLFTSRSMFWKPAIDTFLDSPILGQGPYTFLMYFVKYYSVPPTVYYFFAHSLYLDLLSSTGIIGLAAFLVFLTFLLKNLFAKLHIARGSDLGVLLGALGACVVFFVHSFFDSFYHTEPVASWMLAIICGTALSISEKPNKKSRLAILGVIILPVTAVIYLWTLAPYQSSLASIERGEWKEGAQMLTTAVNRDPYLLPNYQQLGIARAVLAIDQPQENLEEAINAFRKTVALDPTWAEHHLNLGALYLANNQRDPAIEQLKLAVTNAPRCAICYLNLGIALEQDNQLAEASQAYDKALNLQPESASGVFWEMNAFRTEVRDKWLANHPLQENAGFEELMRRRDNNPNVARNYVDLAWYYLNNADLDSAERMANLAELTGDFVFLDRWIKAEIAAMRGDYREAVAIAEPIIHLQFKQDFPKTSRIQLNTYAGMVFHRLTIDQDLVPQVASMPVSAEWERRKIAYLDWLGRVSNVEKTVVKAP